jgi:hypothetical protein
MKIRNILILLAVIFFGIKFPSWMSQRAEVAGHMGEFKAKINEAIEYQACVNEGPFPFSSRVDPAGMGRTSSRTCGKCDVLYQAGLLDKEVVEYSLTGIAENGKTGFDTRYTLTDLGVSVYVPGTGDGPYSKDPPRFCFGKAQLHKITRTVGPVNFGGQKNLGIRYVAVLENPHSFLKDPRAKLLGIPLPTGNPALYPEANVTAVYNGKDFYLDSSLTIGN